VVRRGEVWLYEHPNKPRRPALVLTRDEHIDRQLDVIAISVRMSEVCRMLAYATNC
jgi:hypothetical protein